MAFNFPNSPTDGQNFTPVAGGVSYTWNATTGTWVRVSAGLSAGVYIGDQPPGSPVPGQLWWESDTGNTFIWYADADSSQWVQFNTGPMPPTALPAGGVAWFAMSTPPPGWIKANGAAVSRTTYADLFAALGTLYGAGDGSTTFAVPDLRGEFVRGWDDGRNIDGSRVFGSLQTDALQNMTGVFKLAGAGGGMDGHSGVFYQNNAPQAYGPQSNPATAGVGQTVFDASRVARTSTETRPRNVALLACIKY